MVCRLRLCALVAILYALAAATAAGADFFAAPGGRANGSGSITEPWDIATALAQPRAVGPGDVIWLRGGIYALEQTLVSRLAGAEHNPIVVRQFPGERATLDCRLVTETGAGTDCLLLKSVHAWYWGFEITNSTQVRRAPASGSTADPRGLGVQSQAGLGTKLINLVIHDVGTSLFESQRSGIEIYGTIAYNSGWEGPDRSHGPGFYVRNRSDAPRKLIRDNIVFQHYRQGLQGYGTFPNVFSNFLVEGNVFFNNGIGADGFHRNLMFGNENTDHRDNVFRENFTYFSAGAGAGANTLGSAAGGCQGLAVLGNVFAHGPGRAALEVYNCAGAEISGNLFFGGTSFQPAGSAPKASSADFRARFPTNTYYGDGSGAPGALAAFLRPNRYEPERAHLIVYNWARLPEVLIDVTSLSIPPGERYEIRSAQDYFGRTLSGIYRGGPVSVPMDGWAAARPIGYERAELPPALPEFGVFVLTWGKPAGNSISHRRRAAGAARR
jgi:hypothetical protein